MSSWTNVPKPTNPTVNTFSGGQPIGLLLALTQTVVTTSIISSWVEIAKPNIASWAGIAKPTVASWAAIKKPSVAAWTGIVKPSVSTWTKINKPV